MGHTVGFLDRTTRTSSSPDADRAKGTGRALAPSPRLGLGLGIALAAVATVVWSGSFVTSRALHDSVPPVQQAFWRWIVALAALAPFAARAAWRQRHVLRRHLGFLLLASLLGIAAYNTLVNQAALSTSAGTMGMIMAASPVLMAVYERVGGVRLGVRRIVGMLIACAGVLLLMGGGRPSLDFGAGDLWMAGAAACFASYSALLRHKPREIDGLAFLFAAFVLGTAMLLPAYAVSLAVQGLRPDAVDRRTDPLRRRLLLRARLLRLEQGDRADRCGPGRGGLLPPAGVRGGAVVRGPGRGDEPRATALHGADPGRGRPQRRIVAGGLTTRAG